MLPGVEYSLLLHARRGDALLVGEAPSKGGDPRKPLTGSVGFRLAELAGVRFPDGYARRFGRCNLLDYWPGPAEHGASRFDFADGLLAAERLVAQLEEEFARRLAQSGRPWPEVPPVTVVMLGRRVEACFRKRLGGELGQARWFEWWRPQTALRLATFPHPSQVSRFWNEAKNVSAASLFLRQLVEASSQLACARDYCRRNYPLSGGSPAVTPAP